MNPTPLLITGFGPFPGMPSNPSAALARRVGAALRLRSVPGRPPRVLILRTAYAALPEMLAPALAEKPDAVLMIGVASRSRRVRIEDCARGRASRLHPDVSGKAAGSEDAATAVPFLLRSRSAAPALAVLHRHGVAARRSHDAGRYLCNAAYHRALAQNPATLFVHVPPVPRTKRPRPADVPKRRGMALAAALAEIAIGLAVRARTARRS